MNEDMRLTKPDSWIARMWRIISDWDEAISVDRCEYLERPRLSVLEQKVWDSNDPLAHPDQGLPSKQQGVS